MGQKNVPKPDAERRNVRFEIRVKIHEFEKYLEDAEDYGGEPVDESSDNDGYDSEYEGGPVFRTGEE